MLSIIIFILILSILVMIHELGHFIMAKRSGIGVEEFGFGLPPRAWGKKIGKTIYSINWLPFGGFVRLVGEDSTDEKSDRKDSFNNKPILARIKVVVAGVVMNLVLAVVIFYIVIIALGFKVSLPKVAEHNFKFTNQSERLVVIDITANQKDKELLKSGEGIVEINGIKMSSTSDFYQVVSLLKDKDVQVVVENIQKGDRRTIQAKFSTQVFIAGVEKNSAAQQAGIRAGDAVKKVNGQDIITLSQLQSVVRSSENKELTLILENLHKNETRTVHVTPVFSSRTQAPALGVSLDEIFVLDSNATRRFSVADFYVLHYETAAQKLFAGFGHSYNLAIYTVKLLGQIIDAAISTRTIEPVSQSVSGPVGIAINTGQIIGQGFIPLLGFMGYLSLNLAVMNILPIPALDGGRFFFLIVEAVTRKRIYPSVEKWVHTIGFAVLIGLTLLITFNDILKLIN